MQIILVAIVDSLTLLPFRVKRRIFDRSNLSFLHDFPHLIGLHSVPSELSADKLMSMCLGY